MAYFHAVITFEDQTILTPLTLYTGSGRRDEEGILGFSGHSAVGERHGWTGTHGQRNQTGS